MKIAFVNPEYPSPSGLDHGGIATYTYSMADACAAIGHTVHVFVKKGTAPPPISSNVTINIFEPAAPRSPFRIIQRSINGHVYWQRCYSIGLRKALLSIDTPDEPLDIAEVPEYNGLAFALGPSMPFPVVIHFHTPTVLVDFYNAVKTGLRQRLWHAFEKKALSAAMGFRCPSNALAFEVSSRYRIAQNRITILPHPFDTTPFDAISKKHIDSPIDILFVGRLERRKGADFIRAHMKSLLGLDPRIRFTFAGELSVGDMGNYRVSIERMLSEPERKRVYFLGPVKRRQLPVLYCRSSILLMPSIFENAPYTLLEAIAAHLPVVAARSGGIPEIIRHGENGLLFDPNDGDDMLKCIVRMIQNKESTQAMARQAYVELREKNQPNKVAENALTFYREIIMRFKQ